MPVVWVDLAGVWSGKGRKKAMKSETMEAQNVGDTKGRVLFFVGSL